VAILEARPPRSIRDLYGIIRATRVPSSTFAK
jgi:hypothetical protein